MKKKKLSQKVEALIKDIEEDEEFRAPEPWEDGEIIWVLRDVVDTLKRYEE